MVEPYKPLYTVREAAQLLMVNKDFVNREITNGQLPVLNLGRRKIRGSDLEKYIENYPANNLVIEKGEMK